MVLKIERNCPRCYQWGNHWIHQFFAGRRVVISCADCGHRWHGRVLQRDLTDNELIQAKAERTQFEE